MSWDSRKEYLDKKYQYIDDEVGAVYRKQSKKKKHYPARHKHQYINVVIHYIAPHNSTFPKADTENVYRCSVCELCGKVNTSIQPIDGYPIDNLWNFLGLVYYNKDYPDYREYYDTHFKHLYIPDFDLFKTKYIDVSLLND